GGPPGAAAAPPAPPPPPAPRARCGAAPAPRAAGAGAPGAPSGPLLGHRPYTLPEPYRPVPVTAADWPSAPALPVVEPLRPAPSGLPPAAAPAPAAPDAGDPPLPRRVRQASLVDELRIAPDAPPAAPRPPRWDENPLFRPAPRRAGAAIGAFQRRSRAARAGDLPAAPPAAPADDTWNTPPIPTREDRS
ncbi:histidine kinase, partial [Kitasatospora sp. NPDC059571]